MARSEMDNIQIVVDVQTGNSTRQINRVATALEKLNSAAIKSNGNDFSSVTELGAAMEKLGAVKLSTTLVQGLNGIASALKGFSNVNGQNITSVANAITQLSSLKISGTTAEALASVGETLKTLEMPESARETFGALSILGTFSMSSTIPRNLNDTALAIKSLEGVDLTQLEALIDGLERLKAIGTIKIIGGNGGNGQGTTGQNVATDNTTASIGGNAVQLASATQKYTQLNTLITKLKANFQDMFAKVKKGFSDMGNKLDQNREKLNAIGSGITSFFDGIGSGMAGLQAALSSIGTKLIESGSKAGIVVGIVSHLGAAFVAMGRAVVRVAGQLVGLGKKLVKWIEKPFKRIKERINETTSKFEQFAAIVKRLVMRRAIMAVLRQITDGIKEGVENLYHWSELNDGTFAASMDKIATSMQYFKNSIAAAISPIINSLAPAIDLIVDKVVTLLNFVNLLLAKISGATTWTKAVKVSAKYLEDSAESAKELKQFLLGIDEIHAMSSNSSSSSDDKDYSGMFTTVTEGVDGSLADVFSGFGDSWEKHGKPALEAVQTAWEDIKKLIDTVKTSFEKAFDSPTGQALLNTVFKTVENISGAVDELAKGFTKAWKEFGVGDAIATNILGLFESIVEKAELIWGAVKKWASDLDWSPLLTSVNSALKAFTDLHGFLNEQLAWVWENVLLPLGKWVIEDAAPKSVELLSEAFRTLQSFLDPIVTGFKEAWAATSDLRAELKSLSEEVFNTIIGDLQDIRNNMSEEDINKIKTAAKELGTVLQTQVIEKLKTILKWIENKAWGENGTNLINTIRNIIISIENLGTSLTVTYYKLRKIQNTLESIGITIKTLFFTGGADLREAMAETISGNRERAAENDVLDEKIDRVQEESQARIDAYNEFFDAIETGVNNAANTIDERVTNSSNLLTERMESGRVATCTDIFEIAGTAVASSHDIDDAVGTTTSDMMSSWKDTYSSVSANLADMKYDGKEAMSSVTTSATTTHSSITGKFSSLASWWSDNVSNPITNKSENAFDDFDIAANKSYSNLEGNLSMVPSLFSSAFNDSSNGISQAFSSTGSVTEALSSGISGYLQNLINRLVSKINSFFSDLFGKLNNKIIELSNWDIAGWKPFSGLNTVSIPQLSYLANGGVLPSGAGMFVAGERGPELVATASGGASAVLNNDQITASVAGGVARANEQQNSLLREQNALLRQLLNKDATVKAVVTASDIVTGISSYNKRVGRQVVSVDV